MPADRTSEDARTSSWKDRYTALESRVSEMKAHDEATRATLAKVRERLHWHEHSLLRPEIVADLLPTRAEWRRRAPQDENAARRESAHAVASDAYAAASVGSRRETVPADADRVEIDGITWWVPRDARAEGQLAHRLLIDKRLPLTDILRTREVISNGTMLDIGANIGLTSVLRAVLGDADVVYAAEPAPDNFACLVRTVVENGLRGVVLPDRVAISDRDGTDRLRLSGSIGGHALIAGADGIEVATMRLDSWVRKLGIDVETIRFVKVDTQGHEAHVLDGALELSARPGVVWQLEFSPSHLRKAGRDPQAVIAQMQGTFTNFIDLNPYAPGDRLRPIAELGEALSYLGRSFTDLLVYKCLP